MPAPQRREVRACLDLSLAVGADHELPQRERSKLTADDADLTRALDRALGDTPLFRELWTDRNAAEQAILRQLATAATPLGKREADARDLLHEHLIEREGDSSRIAVPLFAAWIRERA